MTERQVNAKDVMVDILSGQDDSALMKKYRLTAQGLEHLFEMLVREGLLELTDDKYVIPTKSINAVQIVKDVSSGFTGSQLMKKYRLSPAGLQTVLRKLVDSRLLGIADLGVELYLRLEANMPGDIRERERLRLDFEVQVCDIGKPDDTGVVRDITEEGLGTKGIDAAVDEVKTLMILGDVLDQVPPFVFKAQCRWIKTGEANDDMVAGFQIVKILDRDLERLRRLVELITM